MKIIDKLKSLTEKDYEENIQIISPLSKKTFFLMELTVFSFAILIQSMPFVFSFISKLSSIESTSDFDTIAWKIIIYLLLFIPSTLIIINQIKDLLSKENRYQKNKNLLSIEKDLKSTFSSVEKALFISNELENLNLDLSDENFINFLNEDKHSSVKRETIKETVKNRLDTLNKKILSYREKIEDLEKKKIDIENRGIISETKVFNKKANKKIEYNKEKEISILYKEHSRA